MKKYFFLFLVFLIFIYSLFPDNLNYWKDQEVKARLMFNQGKYQEALILYKQIIDFCDVERIKNEAHYYLAVSYLNMDKYDLAEKYLEYYLSNFPNGINIDDAKYQKGRLFFLQKKYFESINYFNDLLKSNFNDKFLSGIYYYIGEAYYELGKYDEALLYYNVIVEKYSKSKFYEASMFKIKLIDHKRVELVLQNLLKWANEQYLSSLNKFKLREDALLNEINQLKAGSDKENVVTKNVIIKDSGSKDDYEKLLKENRELKERIKNLENSNFSKGVSNLTDSEISKRLEQLKLKEDLLNKKELTLKLLEEQLKEKERKLNLYIEETNSNVSNNSTESEKKSKTGDSAKDNL